MIDPTTLWIKIIQYNEKQAATIANLVGKTWVRRYMRPAIIVYNFVKYLLGRALKNDLIEKQYVIELSVQLWQIFKKINIGENPKIHSEPRTYV